MNLRLPVFFQKKKWHVLCDEFSWMGWQHEGAVRLPGPEKSTQAWEELLAHPPQTGFLLVESVWENFWGYNLFQALKELIRAFRRNGTFVIFWNKEDPAHFEDFLSVAIECDAVLTTDLDCCPKYRSAGVKGPIDVLTFPYQPKVHKPYLPKSKDKKVFFAGAPWFAFPDRQMAYRYFLKPALELGCVDMFARRSTVTNRTFWPKECQPYIREELPYNSLLREYSRYQLGLSISSCPYSPTMYPRRIVEIPMANVLPVSDNNRAVRRLFPEIPVVSSARETRETLCRFLRDEGERKERLRTLQKRIKEKHTYKQAAEILWSFVR